MLFTRGIDRATGDIDNYAQENWDTIFSKADHLWSSFQAGIKNYVNRHVGNAPKPAQASRYCPKLYTVSPIGRMRRACAVIIKL